MFGKGPQAELLRELAWLRQRVAELEAERAHGGRHDGVTGLLSARAFRGRLSEEVNRAGRYRRPLSAAVLEIDDFAGIETRHGFKAGDELLSAIAGSLTALTRAQDEIGRTGRAEFGIVLPETEPTQALSGLQRLQVEIELAGEKSQRVAGASIGLAGLTPGMSAEGLLASARMACEQAKLTGGGRVVLAPRSELLGDQPGEAPQRDAIEALAVALLERDRYTGEHSGAVIAMAAGVARNLGLSTAEVDRIKAAALLHDIGKVAIADEVLRKPGPLTDEEWKLMKEHPVIGERILRVLPGLGAVARIVRHEHERWDGRGYPDGLKGEQIPIGSRIVIVADTYHAITSDRPYRPARGHSEAIEELTRCAGTQFDPRVTAALIGYLYGQRQGGLLPGESAGDAQAPTQRVEAPGRVTL